MFSADVSFLSLDTSDTCLMLQHMCFDVSNHRVQVARLSEEEKSFELSSSGNYSHQIIRSYSDKFDQ